MPASASINIWDKTSLICTLKENWPLLQVSIKYFCTVHKYFEATSNSASSTKQNIDVGHLQKPVTASNFLAETKTQLFSHHTMKEESFKVDAFNERDETGILGRMADILGNSMSTSKISLDGSSGILIGDPSLGLKVDVMGGRGPDEFYSKDIYDIKQSIIALNNGTTEGSSIHADLWSQNLIDSYNKSDNYLSMLDTVTGSSLFSTTGLGRQFQMVLRLIKLRKSHICSCGTV